MSLKMGPLARLRLLRLRPTGLLLNEHCWMMALYTLKNRNLGQRVGETSLLRSTLERKIAIQ